MPFPESISGICRSLPVKFILGCFCSTSGLWIIVHWSLSIMHSSSIGQIVSKKRKKSVSFQKEFPILRASLVIQMVKNMPTMQETQLQSWVQEDPWKGLATHSSILAWRIPWTEHLNFLHQYRSAIHWLPAMKDKKPSRLYFHASCHQPHSTAQF